jgi:8-oxo-dGTP pyrophosphatase MutT (NUDIX family)
LTNPGDPSTLPLIPEDVEVLMVRRKDSMCYTDFIRGKFDPADKTYVRILLDNMTQQEIARIKSETFEALWARLWNNSDRHEYELKFAKDKFDAVRADIDSSSSVYMEPEWGFPKGRRLKCESDQVCAEREFFEETNITRSSYTIVSGIQLEETFAGTNGIMYRHKYFVAVLSRPDKIDIHQRFTNMQKREISAIGWKTMADCMNLTRPQYTQRHRMLQALSNLAETIEVRLPKE